MGGIMGGIIISCGFFFLSVLYIHIMNMTLNINIIKCNKIFRNCKSSLMDSESYTVGYNLCPIYLFIYIFIFAYICLNLGKLSTLNWVLCMPNWLQSPFSMYFGWSSESWDIQTVLALGPSREC